MYESIQSEVYASIATLDQLKKMYDIGAVDIRSYQRESEALVMEVKARMDDLRNMGLDITGFLHHERIVESFPNAAQLLNLFEQKLPTSRSGLSSDQYYDQLGLAVLDVATIHASKGLMGLAELIIEVVKRVPQLKSVSYNDVIEAVKKVLESFAR